MGTVVGAFLFLQKAIFGTVVVAWTWWIPISAPISFAIVVVGARPVAPRAEGVSNDA